jgi:hypothetical protein
LICDRVYAGYVESLIHRQRWQDTEHRPGEKRFPRTRRTSQQDIMISGSGYLESPFDVLLALDLAEIYLCLSKVSGRGTGCRSRDSAIPI